MSKTAFVIMPILHGDDYELYRSIYEFYIRPPLEKAGYAVERADDLQKAGAITKDVVYKLAEVDIVVADLTELNPNVFYELGIRHVLRKNGTVMLVDELKTPKVPFDLSSYRVIQYQGNIARLGKLVENLAGFLENSAASAEFSADNPVHDWLPQLPANAMATASGSVEGKLRTTIASLEAAVKRYERLHGSINPIDLRTTRSPKEIITGLFEDAEAGNLPSDIVQRAEQSTVSGNKRDFLGCIKHIVDRNLKPTQRDFIRLLSCADELELGNQAVFAILDTALEIYQDDGDLQQIRLSKLVRSDERKDRETARIAIRTELGITFADDSIEITENMPNSGLSLLGVMLDSYQQDSLFDEALRITTALVAKFPLNTIVLRNHARSIESVQGAESALPWYRRSIVSPNPDDTSANWYGSTLSNLGRNIDALEVLLLGCLFDIDDPENFSRVADQIARIALAEIQGKYQAGRSLPSSLALQECFLQFVLATISCTRRSEAALRRLVDSARRGSIENADKVIEQVLDGSIQRITVRQKLSITKDLYQLLRSEVTSEQMSEV